MFIILGVLVIYKGLIRITILANSFVVHNDKVALYFPKKTVCNRFDFVSRGQSIVHLPQYGLLDRPYVIEIFSPGSSGGVNSCRMSLNLGHIMEPDAWQRAYENFVRHQEQLSLVVKRQLLTSSAHIHLTPFTRGEGDDVEKYLEPIVSEINLGLENLGFKIIKAEGKFSAGPTLVRLIAAEQQDIEKTAVPVEKIHEITELSSTVP
jgi:hypothetical protein